jgi:hypothetical protein
MKTELDAGFELHFKDMRILFAKDGDTYSDGELYYQLLVNDHVIAGNAECIIAPDGTLKFLGEKRVVVPGLAIKAELRIDELDVTKDDTARNSTIIDLNAAGASSRHDIRAHGANGRLDCTLSFAIDVLREKVPRQLRRKPVPLICVPL